MARPKKTPHIANTADVSVEGAAAAESDDTGGRETEKPPLTALSLPIPIVSTAIIRRKPGQRIPATAKREIEAFIVDSTLQRIPRARIKAVVSKRWCVSERHTSNLFRAADRALASIQPVEVAKRRRDAHVRARMALAHRTDDDRIKLDCYRDIARLDGLYDDKVTITRSDADDLPTNELLAIVASSGGQE